MTKVSEKSGCDACPLRKARPDLVFIEPRIGTGTRLAIGGVASSDSGLANHPFGDGSSNWLRGTGRDGARYGGFYQKAGVKDADVSYLNVVQCVPPVFPTRSEACAFISKEAGFESVCHCVKQYVEPVLKSRPWARIDLFGDDALAFVARKSQSVAKWRGSPLAVPVLGEKLIAISTIHPAEIGKQQEMLPVVINDLRKSLVTPPERYNLMPSLDEVRAFTAREFVFDIETPKYRTMGDHAPIEMVGICAKPYEVMVVPFTGAYVSELKRIFRDATDVIGHNCIQFDLPRLLRDGVEISKACRIWDTMLLQHLRFPNLPHDLEFVGSQFSNKPAWKHDKASFELYCARDVDITMQAYKQLKPLVETAGMLNLYKYVQVPLGKICYEMTALGFKQDPAALQAERVRVLAEMGQLETRLPEELRSRTVIVRKRALAQPGTVSEKTGKPIKYVHREVEEIKSPWRSPTIKAKFLYDTLGLPTQYSAKTKEVTVGKEALDRLQGEIRKLKEPRFDRVQMSTWVSTIKKLGKLGTLLSGFLKDTSNKESFDGKPKFIHPSFNVHGTSTGRLSSSEPNFQNQPETARYLYVPRHTGWKIIEIDYSGIENRLQALFAQDDVRIRRMNAGVSEHKHATSLFFGIPYEDVEKDNDPEAPYNKAKHIVHGTDRGMGAKKITNMYGIEFGESKRLQDLWKREIAKTVEWQGQIAAQAKKAGVLANPFGRKAWFYTSSAYTESISFMPQSTGADVIYRAMIGLMYERIGWSLESALKVTPVCIPLPKPANLLVQVHDALVFECPEALVDEVIECIVRVMEQPWAELGGYTLPVSVSVGTSWGAVEPYNKPVWLPNKYAVSASN